MARVHTELSRNLTLFDITMLGVGAMIGAGIFVLTGIAAGAAGPALILAFALNGVITIFTAMVYAELGSAIPKAGGGYLWVREGLPGPSAFLAGWMDWFAHAVAGSLYALGFASYLGLLITELGVGAGGLDSGLVHKGLAVLIVAVFALINFRGVSETGKAGNVVTVLKIVILLLFVASGFWAMGALPGVGVKFADFAPNGLIGIVNAMGLTFIAFEGYEIIVQAGEEVKDPTRTVPKAVFLSLAIVVPIYILVAIVVIGAVVPGEGVATYQWLAEHAELGVAEAARQFMPLGTVLLLAGGLVSTMSALNATTYSSTRVSFSMGRERHLPAAFAAVHRRTRTPFKALAATTVLIVLMALAVPIQDVAAAATIMFLLLFLQVNVAAIALRRKYGQKLRYGYRIPFFPIVPILGIVTQLFLALFLFNYSPIAWYIALGWIGAGLLAYYAVFRRTAEAVERTPVVVEEREVRADEAVQYHVLVPIPNVDALQAVCAPALDAARRRGGAMTLLHVVHVPDQLPLSAGGEHLARGRALVEEALERVSDGEVPIEAVVRVSHRIAQAIVDTVQERRIDLLVMEWRQRRDDTTAVSANIDLVLEQVGCNVWLVEATKEVPFKTVLAPVEHPAQLPSSLQAAAAVAAEGARVDVLHIFTKQERKNGQEGLQQALEAGIDEFKENQERLPTIRLKTLRAKDPVPAIVLAARGYDALVLQGSADYQVRHHFFGTGPARIAWRVERPVVLVRPKPSALGFGFRRLLHYISEGYRRIDLISLERLQAMGVLQSRSGKGHLTHSPAHRAAMLAITLVGVVGAIAMYRGSGGFWTWVGTAAFLGALSLFTWLTVRGIDNPAG